MKGLPNDAANMKATKPNANSMAAGRRAKKAISVAA